MCQFLSAVVLKNGDVLSHPMLDSHADLVTYFKLPDSRQGHQHFAKVELVPRDWLDVQTWEFRLDEQTEPWWWSDVAQSAEAALRSRAARMVLREGTHELIVDGCWIVGGTAVVRDLRGGRIVRMLGGTVQRIIGGTVQAVSGGTVQDVCGGTVQDVYGGTVQDVYGGTVQRVYGGTVQRVYGGMVQRVCGGTVQRVYGGMVQDVMGGTVQDVSGGTVQRVYGGMVQRVFGGLLSDIRPEVHLDASAQARIARCVGQEAQRHFALNAEPGEVRLTGQPFR